MPVTGRVRAWGAVLALAVGVLWATTGALQAQEPPLRVLWWYALSWGSSDVTPAHRQRMVRHLEAQDGGGAFAVTFGEQRQGGLAEALSASAFDVVVLDATDRRRRFSAADLDALKAFYASGRSALLLDGTLGIRSVTHNPTTEFPGIGGVLGALLVNQVTALGNRGGGILIGTDHDAFQTAANEALRALVPDARFSGVTNPSTNGAFLGRALLGERIPVAARPLLQHWQSIPNQGQSPVGTFTDFLGGAVRFWPLVEAADKPGRGAKRPYISASFDPGADVVPIDSDEVAFEEPVAETAPPLPPDMPTRKRGDG